MYHPIVLICYGCPAMKMNNYTLSVYIFVSVSKTEFLCVCSVAKSCPTL